MVARAEQPTPDPGRRRPGKFRRWLLRPLIWTLIGVLLALVAGVLFLQSDYVRERARAALVERLAAYLDRPVAVESLVYRLLPTEIELRGVRIGGTRPGEEPFLTLDRLVVEVDAVDLYGPGLRLGRVLAERPVVRLLWHRDGGDNLPRTPRRPASQRRPMPAPVAVFVGRLDVVGGAVEVEHRRAPVELSGESLQASLAGADGPRLRGRLQVENLEIELPRARPYVGSVRLTLDLEKDGLRIVDGSLDGPLLAATVGGEWRWRRGDTELRLDVRARGEAALFDALGYTRGQISGPFELDGGVAVRPRLWGYRAALTSAGLDLFGRRLDDVSAVISGDRHGIRADVQQAVYGGGQARGYLSYSPEVEGRPFDLQVRVDDVSLRRVLLDQGIPLDGVDGLVRGLFSYRFPVSRPQRGDGWGDLRFRPRPQPVDDRLQLGGSAALVIDRGMLRSQAIRASSAWQQVLVAGAYDLETGEGRFDLEVDSRRVTEVVRLLPLSEEQVREALWVPEEGSGRLDGQLRLGDGVVVTTVALDLFDVEAPGFAADRLQGALEVDGRGIPSLRLELLGTDAAAIVDGAIPFTDGEGAPLYPFSIGVDLANWPADDVRAWLPFTVPVSGGVSGTALLHGDLDALEGEVEVAVAPAVLAGLPVEAVEIDLLLEPEQMRFRRVEARSPAGNLRLSGSLERADGRLALRLDSDPLLLGRAPFSELLAGELGGSLRVAGGVSGTLEQPRLDGDLFWDGLSLGGRPLDAGEPTTAVDWDGERLAVSGALPGLDRFVGGGALDREGFDVDFELAAGHLGPLAAILAPPELGEVGGSFEGRLSASGRFETPVSWRIDLSLDRLDVRHGDLTLASVEPVELRWVEGGIEIDSLFLVEPETANELFVGGRIGLGGERPLDLNLQSTLESEWLGLLLPQIELQGGVFEGIGSITGTGAAPRLDGVATLTGARLPIPALTISCDDIGGRILFYPQRIVLDDVRGQAGGGEIRGGGSVLLHSGWSDPEYRLEVSATDLSVPFPEGWLMRGDARLALDGNRERRELRGEIDLERAFFLQSVKVGLESALGGLFEQRRVEYESTDEMLASTALNLQINGEGALRVRNNLADLSGDLDLTLRGTLAAPVLFGSAELEPGGTLNYAGNEYVLERGTLNFANPYRIQPVLDVSAVTELREYDLRLGLSGSLDRLEVDVASDPPLADLEALSLLTGGRPALDSGIQRRAVDQRGVGVEGFLAGEAASVVTERVNRLFGLDRLRVDPLTSTSGDLSSVRVTVGERLSRDLSVTYSYDPSTTEEQILELEWSVSRRLVLVLTQNGDESYAMDLRWEKAF